MESWRASLLDLSIDNPLIDTFGIDLIADPQALAAMLTAGRDVAIDEGEGVGVPISGKAFARLAPAELARELIALQRDCSAQRTAHGEHALWLGLGILAWSDGGDRVRRAPLVLFPVELEQTPGGAPRLISAVEPGWLEPQRNMTLVEKLRRDFDLVLDGELPALLEAAEGIALTRPGWSVERNALLGCFAPAQAAIWRDLEGREDELLAHPLVSQIARGGEGLAFAQPSGAAAAAVTGRPGSIELSDLLAPLDADATQLQAVAAAGAGASFVLQAPPGTGATQTIANLIAHCTASGKSVLLVSDQVAALDAIRERLASVGLGDLCLSLTSRATALAQLERVLSRSFRPHQSNPAALRDTHLGELRAALDGHAASLHRTGAFGRSLHTVLGRLVELRTTPRAALADIDAVGLDGGTFERRLAAVERLAAATVRVDPVASHPWRTSKLTRETFGPDGRARALTAIDDAAAAATALRAAVREVAGLIPNLVARSREQLIALGALATLAATSPRPGAELLTASRPRAADQLDEQVALIRARGGDKTALEAPRDPHGFLVLARRHRLLTVEVRDKFTDAVDGIDATGLWAQLKKWTHSMAPVRFVALRAARAEVKAVAQPVDQWQAGLETDASMIDALEAVIAERACRAVLEAAAEPARRWFGELGGATLTLDLDAIDQAAKWGGELRETFDAVDVLGGDAGREASWRALVAHVAAGTASGDDVAIEVLARLGREATRWDGTLDELSAATGIDLQPAVDGDHLAMLVERTATLRHTIDQLADWVTFYDARHDALASGVGPAVASIERGDLAAADLAPAWERATLLAWADAELADSQVADGPAHHAHVSAFADLDRAALAMVRSRALVRFAERVPAVPPGKLDPDTELGGLLTELRAAKPTQSLREMFAGIPLLLSRIAPCIAVTPGALAHHLDPKLTFDVVVFDHASQLSTAAAIGALSRATSAVIVGDSQLLPPLKRVRGESVELGGLLADALASRLPELRLGWLYRARHEEVVAYANEQFYGDRLQVFPAVAASPELGLAMRAIARAPEVVAELLGRLRDPSNQGRSLGLVVFSRTLRDAVLDLIDDVRRDEPRLFDALTEPLAISHVDDAQGLVRDVVLVVLDSALDPDRARSAAGPSPASRQDNQLCVALTRAREQLVLCTGALPELGGALASLVARAQALQPVEQTPASPITEAIARALADRGWAVRHQVGSGGYKIDLAVLDPVDPERYVLAIETDGAAYASAPIARDRDRLRAQVLTQLGWRLQRIWALDWWANPEYEIQRTHAAIVTAIAATRRRAAPAARPRAPRERARPVGIGNEPTQPQVSAPMPAAASSSGPIRAVARESSAPIGDIPETLRTMPNLAAGSAPIRIAKNQIPIGPYVVAAIPPGRRTPDDLFALRHLPELRKVIEQVLAAEAPMHVDLLARRVGAYFGIGRVTPRVTDQIRVVLDGRGKLGDEQDIVWRLDQDPSGVPAVRVAGSSGSSTGRREIAEIPLSELAAAARIIVERSTTIATPDLVRDAARLVGFARITQQISERVAEGVRLAQLRELIRIDAGKARMPEN